MDGISTASTAPITYFQHPTKGTLSIPVHRNKVKAVYARKVDKACEEEKK
jgi:hypothetical protein